MTKFARLAALKQRWDPENTFRLNANIAPANVAPTAQPQGT